MACSAVVLRTQNANAMSELEELMGGEPVEALSDNELDELRGGFRWGGMNFNFGFDAETRVSTAVLDTVQSRIDNIVPQIVNRQEDFENEQFIADQTIEQSIDGAPIVTNNSITNVVEGGTIEAETATDAGLVTNTAVLDEADLSFASGQGVDPAPVAPGVDGQVGSSAAPLVLDGTSDLVTQVTQAIVNVDNANVAISRTLNVDITGFSMFDAMAARSRVESQITNVINSQVLFQLGQQF